MADKGSLAFPAAVAAVVIFVMAPTGGSDEPSPSSSDGDGSSSSRPIVAAPKPSPEIEDDTSVPDPPASVEGVDPESTVCADYARTVQGKNAVSSGKVYARVELRYSPLCRASWVRTLGSAGERGNPVATWGRIVRTADGTVRTTEHCSSTFCWSDMVDVAGRTAYAEGGFDYGAIDVEVRTKRY